MDHTLPVTATPAKLVLRHCETEVRIARPRQSVWAWLCDPATFSEGQVWPYRVEFIDADTGQPAGFRPGVLTNHHGPLLNFAGVIGEMRAPEYRDLAYTYGAFFLGPRVCRPVRLQMWLREDGPDATIVRIGVDAQVRKGLGRISDRFQRVFWKGLARAGQKAIPAS